MQAVSSYYNLLNFLNEVVSGDIMTPSSSLVEGCPSLPDVEILSIFYL